MAEEDYWADINPDTLLSVLTVWRDFLKAGPTDEHGVINSAIISLDEEAPVVLGQNI